MTGKYYSIDEENKKGNIEEVLERKNEFIRPAIANIDQALVVFAIKKPEPNLNSVPSVKR